MNELKLAWCGGLFDGEGSFGVLRHSKDSSYSIRAQLAMTDEETVEEFASIINMGEIHPTISTDPKRKDSYKWLVSNVDAPKVAKILLPYLITKRRQAELVIEFDSKWRRLKHSHDTEYLSSEEFSILDIIVHEMKLLNMRGPGVKA